MGQRAPTTFTKLHQQAGLSFDEAIALIDVSRSTGFRYQAGTSEPSGAALKLLEEAASKRASKIPGWFTFIDLFAGIGGLRMGFESIGGRCVFTSEWDLNSQKTYANNFPDNHKIEGDVRDFSKDPSLIPEHDVLLAGFPCQPFSIAGVSKKNALGRPHGFLCDIAQFASYIDDGAMGIPPIHLLNHPDTSEPIGAVVKITQRNYPNRYDFGRELVMRLNSLDVGKISNDRGLWTWIALYLFDQICPADQAGRRKLDKQYRYILSTDYRHYYRHLVRTPWQLCRDHGANSRFLLLAAEDGENPLRRHGDILEQLGGTQSIIRSRPIIAEATRLYADPISGRPKKGVAGKGAGSIRRFARVLRQLDLTFDPNYMPPGGLSAVLPREFESWKRGAPKASPSSAASNQEIRPQS